MPAKFNLQTASPREQLLVLGQQIKRHRKANKLSAEAVATAAGLSRITPRQAWDIYVRNWRHIDETKITADEQQLNEQLRAKFEPGSKDGA